MMKKKYVILLMCFMMITFLSSCMKKSSFGGSMQNEMDAPDKLTAMKGIAILTVML